MRFCSIFLVLIAASSVAQDPKPVAERLTAQKVPLVRPTWRPTRFMCSEAGIVASALPRIQQLTGSVASAA